MELPTLVRPVRPDPKTFLNLPLTMASSGYSTDSFIPERHMWSYQQEGGGGPVKDSGGGPKHRRSQKSLYQVKLWTASKRLENSGPAHHFMVA